MNKNSTSPDLRFFLNERKLKEEKNSIRAMKIKYKKSKRRQHVKGILKLYNKDGKVINTRK